MVQLELWLTLGDSCFLYVYIWYPSPISKWNYGCKLLYRLFITFYPIELSVDLSVDRHLFMHLSIGSMEDFGDHVGIFVRFSIVKYFSFDDFAF